MAKSSTRRVTIYINGKEVEASVKQIRVEMNRLHNGQNRMVVVGDSATSYRRRRNDVRRRMRGREKMGGGESLSVASDTISAAHLFPLFPVRGTPFRETRSVERNLLLTPVCLRGRRHLPTDAIAASGTSNFPFAPRAQHRHSALDAQRRAEPPSRQ
ncbi:MAG: hypothetical protein II535_05165 [Bacteroidales bacterium]|nr:hypothetical protein [Bacteroidales bacterium]